jgi:hypothetical protein
MTTYTATRAASTFPTFKGEGSGALCVAYGTYTLASNLAAATVIEMCKVPAGAVVIGGEFIGVDLDTDATEELDWDIGWLANGVESADTDGLGNLGVITGDAFAAGSISMSAGMHYNLASTTGSKIRELGPLTFSAETTFAILINTDAATGGTGLVQLYIYYVCP